MKNIFNDASMSVREFLSNNKEFNSKIPEQDQAETNEFKRILGINWNPGEDINSNNPKTLEESSTNKKNSITVPSFSI